MNAPENLIIAKHDLRWRRVDTSDGELWVPQYISRYSTGWTIRLQRKEEPAYREYIPDQSRCADWSLDRAIERLPDILPDYTPYDCLRNRLTRYYYVYEYLHRGLTRIQVNAKVCCHQKKLRLISYYAGTENTVTQDRLDQCIAKAIGTRVWASEMIRDCGRSVLIHEPLPNHVEDYANIV